MERSNKTYTLSSLETVVFVENIKIGAGVLYISFSLGHIWVEKVIIERISSALNATRAQGI